MADPSPRARALSYAGRRLRSLQINGGTGSSGLSARLVRVDDQGNAGIVGTYLEAPLIPAPRPATEADALGMPAFGRSVALIANALAGTDWYARRLDPATGLRITLADQPAIVTNPSPLETIWDYRWSVAEDGILYGNHFALLGEIDWRTQRPGWMLPLPADQVWLMTDPARPGWYEWAIGGDTFGPDEIFHVPFGSRSGELCGRGVIAQYADWLAGSREAEEYSRDTFAAGALPPAVITSATVATPEQAADLKAKWRELTSTREPVIFPNGTTMVPVIGNAEQAQLVQARTWNAQQLAMIVGVPGWKLGLDGPTMTYQNVETGDIDFVRDSVDRWGRPVTEAFSKWLMPRGTELAWNYDSRMRADQKTTAEILKLYVEAGIMTVDEARARLNLGPLGAPLTAEAFAANTQSPADAAAAARLQVTSGSDGSWQS